MYRAILVGACMLAGVHANNGLALEANEVFKRADPSVVVIVAEGAKRTDDRLVSGVLIEPLDIVTNCRAVTSAVKIVVKQGSVQRTAKIRYQDAARDLCQIRLDDALPSGKPVTAYVLSKELEVGQQVFAIGSPRGLEHTISRGIVSALREMKEEAGNLVQTDAAISPGSSGGGLFDSEGRLVGVITFGFKDAQNLNFALPSEWILDLPKRNRDRLSDSSPTQPDQVANPGTASKSAASGFLRVGDRWKYKLIDGRRSVGTVVIEIVEARDKFARERITREDDKKFVAERTVDADFNPIRFQEVITHSGGLQLAEISPYMPEGQELKQFQQWSDIPVSLLLVWYGKHKFTMQARVIGPQTVRVPAGQFNATLIEAGTNENLGTSIVKVTCRFWYAPEVKRTVKMTLQVEHSLSTINGTSETYELTAFEPAK
jgi:hypothetical protein